MIGEGERERERERERYSEIQRDTARYIEGLGGSRQGPAHLRLLVIATTLLLLMMIITYACTHTYITRNIYIYIHTYIHNTIQ